MSQRPTRFARWKFLPLVGAIAAMLVLPGAAAAATRPIKFDVTTGQGCVYGTASDGATLNLLWKSAAGTRKVLTTVHASTSDGFWRYCSTDGDKIAVGDRIRANDGTSAHELIVPELTLVINRVDDRFKGRGPAGDYVRLFCGYSNGFEPCQSSWKLKVNAQGQWGYSPGWDVQGWQQMFLRWRSDAGDSVRTNARGPYVDVTIGSPIVRGASRANAPVTVVLRRAGSNDVAATATTTAGAYAGLFQTKFRNPSGNTVKVRVGDRITSDVSPDEDWIVPNVTAHADASSDTVTGTCPDDSFFAQAEVMRNGVPESNYTWPEDDATNSFEIDMSHIDVNIVAGESVRVSCFLLGPGDWTGRLIVAE